MSLTPYIALRHPGSVQGGGKWCWQPKQFGNGSNVAAGLPDSLPQGGSSGSQCSPSFSLGVGEGEGRPVGHWVPCNLGLQEKHAAIQVAARKNVLRERELPGWKCVHLFAEQPVFFCKPPCTLAFYAEKKAFLPAQM